MKRMILIAAFALLAGSAQAQFILRAGLAGGVPTGTMADGYKATAGVEVSLKYALSNQVTIGVTSGFQHFFNKDWTGYQDINFNMVPVRASFTYYLAPGIVRPYIGAEAGIHMTELSYSYYLYGYYYSGWYSRDYSHTRFGIVPMAGIEFGSGPFAFDLSARYTSVAEVSSDAPAQDISFLSAGFGAVIRF
jgi:hypothetical protein